MEKIDEIDGERWEARKLEGEYQKNNDCVNIKIENRTKKEYYNDNKQAILEKVKELYNLNKQAILEKKKEKIICECGAKVAKRHLARHRKSKKHINFINSANND